MLILQLPILPLTLTAQYLNKYYGKVYKRCKITVI